MAIVSLLLSLVVVLAVVVIAASGGRPFRRLRMNAIQASSAEAANLRVRLRNFSALAAATLVALLLGTTGLALVTDLGRLVLLTPILTASAAIAFFALVPTAPFRENTGARSADLARRRPWSFGPRWIFILPATAAVALLVVTIGLGLAADADGRSISLHYALGTSSAGPFPGFSYGVPLLAAMTALVGVAVIALARIASAARPSDESLRAADATIRMLAIRVVTKATTSALLCTLGVVLFLAGISTVQVAAGVRAWEGAVDDSLPPEPALVALGVIEIGSAVLALILGLALLLWAIADAARKPFELTRLAEATA